MKSLPLKKERNRIVPLLCAPCLALALLSGTLSAPATAQTPSTAPDTPATMNTQTNMKSMLFASGKQNPIPWLCYYGWDRGILKLPEYKLLILEADGLGPLTKKDKAGRLCIAYMSIGEISESRWFWPLVQGKPWLLEKNTDWTDARKIDPRSQEWSDLLVTKIAPALLAAGYDGFMLDNVDTGEYLERKDPAAYAGAKEAIVGIIQRLRQTYPEAVIIANSGLETIADTARSLDAVICEGTYSRWIANANGSFSYTEISLQDKAWLRPKLLRLQGAGLPILALEYVDTKDAAAKQRVSEAVKKAGYHPYMAERSLMELPQE